jgi:hypothetical protein
VLAKNIAEKKMISVAVRIRTGGICKPCGKDSGAITCHDKIKNQTEEMGLSSKATGFQ